MVEAFVSMLTSVMTQRLHWVDIRRSGRREHRPDDTEDHRTDGRGQRRPPIHSIGWFCEVVVDSRIPNHLDKPPALDTKWPRPDQSPPASTPSPRHVEPRVRNGSPMQIAKDQYAYDCQDEERVMGGSPMAWLINAMLWTTAHPSYAPRTRPRCRSLPHRIAQRSWYAYRRARNRPATRQYLESFR